MRSLELYQELGNKLGAIQAIIGLAATAGAHAELVRSARLFGAASGLLTNIGASLEPTDRVEYERDLEGIRAHLDEQIFATAWSTGQEMSLDQAVEYALHGADNVATSD